MTAPNHVGILLNPKSGHVRRNLVTLRRLASRIPRSILIEVSSPLDITQALDIFNLSVDDLLVVIGGDGSLQAALTASLRRSPESTPYFLALSAGTTNMSATDLGMRMKPASALCALSRWLTADAPSPTVNIRSVVKVSDASSAQPQFGLFFGAGTIIDGVRYFHSEVSTKGLRGASGPALAFLRMLLGLFRRKDEDIGRSTSAGIQLQQGYMYSHWLVILATTLNKLLLKSTPYWGDEQAPMHFTAIAHRAPRLLSSLPLLLRGRASNAMRNSRGYVSENLIEATIHNLREYLLDGEIFATCSPLSLSADTSVRFIQLEAITSHA